MDTTRKALLALGLITLLLVHAPAALADSEAELKAKFLYNFANLVDWPKEALPAAASPFVIGVFGGEHDFVELLTETVENKSVGHHAIKVKFIASESALRSCNLIFFPASEQKRTANALAALNHESVLLIGEDENFLPQGGMIDMVLRGGKISFAIDRERMERANLPPSPTLLALAVSTAPGEKTAGQRRVKFSPDPNYPDLARQLNLTGTVQLKVAVQRDGTVKEATVVGGHPVLAEALVKAVMKWKYESFPKDTVEVVRFTFEHVN